MKTDNLGNGWTNSFKAFNQCMIWREQKESNFSHIGGSVGARLPAMDSRHGTLQGRFHGGKRATIYPRESPQNTTEVINKTLSTTLSTHSLAQFHRQICSQAK